MSVFGVAVSPFDVDDWTAATGLPVDACMIFEAWANQRSLAPTFARAAGLGHRSIMVTWEPWKPTPAGLANDVQGAPQPEWDHASILAGDHDAYIDQFARDARAFPGTVWLRWGHEANGGWYPWSHDPAGYVAAWKYLRARIRSARAAWNVHMVWSPNLDLWRPNEADWLARLLPYWPGPAAVDHVGCTMINFGGSKNYPVALFAERLALASRLFGRPLTVCEMNVARQVADAWLADLTAAVQTDRLNVGSLFLSQGPSRAESTTTGDLSWQLPDHPELVGRVASLAYALSAIP